MKEQENIQKEQKKSFQFNTNCQTVQVQYSPPRHNLQLIEIVVYNHNQNHAYRFKFSQQNLYQQKELHERYSCLREFYDELQESLYSQPGDPSLSMQIPEISQMILRFKRKNRSRGEIKLKGRKILLKSEEMIETKLRHMGQKISQNQRQIKKLKEKTQSKDAQVFRMKGESNLMKKDLQSFTSEYQNFKKQVHSCLKQVCTYIFNPKKQIQNLQDQIKLKLGQLRTYLSNQRTEFIEASLHSEEEILIKVKSITERLQKIEQNKQLKNLRTQIYESKNTLQLGLEKLNRQFQNKIKHDFIQLAKDSNEFSREVDQRLKCLENKVWTNFQSFKQEQIRQKELQKKEDLQKTVPKNAQNSEKQYSLPRVCLFNQQLGQFIKQPLKKYDFVKLQFKKNKSLANIPNIRSKSTYFHDLIGFKDKKIVSYSISIERTDRFRIALGIVQHKNMEICMSNSQAIEKAYFLDLEKGAFFNYRVIQNYVLKQDIGRSISLSINPQKQKAIWSSKEDILEIQDLGNLLQTNQLRMFILLTDFRDEIQVKRQYR